MLDTNRPGGGVFGLTGCKSYDQISWSGKPRANVVLDKPSQLAVIDHLGVDECGERAWSHSIKHEVATVTLNLAGVGRYTGKIGDQRFDGPIRCGAISFVPPATPIDLEFPAAHSCLHLTLPKTKLVQFQELTHGPAFDQFHTEHDERLAQMTMMIDREVREPGFASDLMIDGLVRALLTMFSRPALVEPSPPGRLHLSPVKLKRVIDYVEANLGEPISLIDMASVADLSVFHFSRMFKLATGDTPYHFVAARRLARAELLLRTTELPLAQLALDCGFASQSHFNAAFLKAMGTTPGRYRRAHPA